MAAEPGFRERELLDVVAAYAAGKAVEIGPPPDAPPGELVERTKAFKGVDTALPPEARTDRLRFEFDQVVLPGFEWHGVERDPRYGVFQWSGPGTRSSLHLPLANDRDLDITVKVLHAVAADVLQNLRLEVNGEPVPLARRPDPSGGTLFEGRIPAAVLARSAGFVRLTFLVDRTVEPRTFDPSNVDPRRLGLAFNWIEVRPAE